jgi:hypothetical protein
VSLTWSRLARTFRRGRHDADIEEELRFHLDMDVADGQSPREARLRLGSATRIHEDTRAAGILEWLDSTLRDVRIGWRQLRRTPGLTAAVVLSLTIGIGSNAAIFSLVDAALLRPLPVSDPDSLRLVGWTNVRFPPGADNVNGEFRPIGAGKCGRSDPAYCAAPGTRTDGLSCVDWIWRGDGRGTRSRRRIAGGTSQRPVNQRQLLPGAGCRRSAAGHSGTTTIAWAATRW